MSTVIPPAVPLSHTFSRIVMQTPGQRKPRVAARSPWTIGTIAVVIYLFITHSFKLNIGSEVIAVGLFAVLLHERPIFTCPPMYWYAAFLGWSLITVPASMSPSVSFDAWIEIGKIWLVMFLVLNVIRTPAQHRLVTLAWLGMFAFFPVRGTLVNFMNGNGEFGRYGWNFQFQNYNDMATLTLIPLAMSLDRLRSHDKKWVKACALVGVIALPFIILITQSRAGMMGLALFMLYLFARSRYRAKLTAAIVGIGIVALVFAPQGVWDRISKMSYLTSVDTLGQSDSSAEQRYVIWQVARAIIADNPVIGVGIGEYPYVHEAYARTKPEWEIAHGRRDTHSTYLHIFAETGIIGIALYVMIFVSAFRELTKAARALKGSTAPGDPELRDRLQAYQAAFVGIAMCAVFGSIENMVFPFLLIALGAASVRMRPGLVQPKDRALSRQKTSALQSVNNAALKAG
jgi:probable O-glycosylation ligase (exosortase A-associated)